MKVRDFNKWQWTTVASDGLLAYTAYYCADKLLDRNRLWSALGCLIICAAASVGSLRFGPFPKLEKFHHVLASACASVALPFIGYAVQRWYKIYQWTDSTLCTAVVLGFVAKTVLPLPTEVKMLYDLVAACMGLMTIYVQAPAGGVEGVALCAVSALIAVVPVGMRWKSKVARVLAVDIFHVGFAAGLRMIMQSQM